MTHSLYVAHKGETRIIQARDQENLFDALAGAGLMSAMTCGGHGKCGKCGVRVILGEAPERSKLEGRLFTRESGVRLACLLRVTSDMRLETIGQERRERILTRGVMPDIDLAPLWTKRYDAAEKCSILRYDGAVQVRESGNARMLGLAADIGTTTVALYLIDLESGDVLNVQSAVNAQAAYGADVISRAQMTMEKPDGLMTLCALIRGQLNMLAAKACGAANVKTGDIVYVCIAGNPMMTHLFASLSVDTIAVAPYTPQYTHGFDMDAQSSGLRLHEKARVRLLPCISGYVGADTVAAAVACGMDRSDTLSLLIDIGTNGEMMLGTKDRLIACATAAGPAFEGGHIRFGMGGVTGAIDRVWVEDGRFCTSVLDDADAEGLCGSGLIDAVAVLLKARCLDETGCLSADKSADEAVAARIVEADGAPVFMLRSQNEGAAHDIYLTQRDIREVQLAKGAIAAGIRILLQDWGAETGDVERVYLAGGFGTYIDYTSACRIGLLPKALCGRIIQAGNAAGAGALLAVRNAQCLERMERLRDSAAYVELAEVKAFQDIFMDEMMFEMENDSE